MGRLGLGARLWVISGYGTG